MTRETVTLSDQARGYWVASTIFRRRIVPAEFVQALARDGVLEASECMATAVETLCVLGAATTSPRLRLRIMKEYPALLPVRAAQ